MKRNANGLNLFFLAQSIAVIGASTRREKVGYQVLNNLLLNDRERAEHHCRSLYPINPGEKSILGLKCYKSITQISDAIDMVVIVTPVGTVLELVEEVIERNRLLSDTKKVRSMVIISAGFAETDPTGKKLQQLIATKLALADIRILGPNTLGLLHSAHRLNASFAQLQVPQGNLGVISQSGAMLTSLFNALHSRNAGISFAVSLGNKADLNENDCLEYALTDSHTSAVIMYIESFSHLPKFFELVSQLRREKPVIVLKGGTSSRGQAASSSHTAALATNHALLAAAAQQFGFTLVENMEELMNTAFFLSHHKHLPTNTMIITNAGGPGVNAIDTMSKMQVPAARWSPHAKKDIEELLPRTNATNPFDLLGDASAEDFGLAIQVAQRDPNIDSITVIITPQAVTDIPAITEIITTQKGKKPLFVTLMGGDHLEKFRTQLREHHIICSAYSNDIIEMLGVLCRAAEQKNLPYRYVLSQSHHPTDAGQRLQLQDVQHRLAHQQGLLASFLQEPTLGETFKLLKTEGFNLPRYWIIDDASTDRLDKLQYPLYVKTANLSIIHKKKVGAVYGVAKSLEDAKAAYKKMRAFGPEVLFQEVLNIEYEILIGIENDPQFCLYLTVGLGGSYTNLIGDRAYCFLPAPRSVIARAWSTTKAAALLKHTPRLDEVTLSTLDALQKLVMKYPWIHSIEINPAALSRGKVWVADIKLQV